MHKNEKIAVGITAGLLLLSLAPLTEPVVDAYRQHKEFKKVRSRAATFTRAKGRGQARARAKFMKNSGYTDAEIYEAMHNDIKFIDIVHRIF